MTPRPHRGRVGKVLTIAAAALASFYVLYLVATNVFLSTSLFDKTVNGRGDFIMIQYERAWSVVPGRIHVRKVWIRSGDSMVQWRLTVDRCAFDVSFYDAVVKRKLRLTDVDASGVSFWGRRRIEAPLATPEYVDALPPIPGFPRIPIQPLEPPDLAERWDDRHYHLITVALENVVARDVREVWVDSVRLRGHLDVKGGFFLKPIRRLEIGPADVQIDDSYATIGEATVAEHLSGSVTFQLTTMDPRYVHGAEFVAFVNARTELRGRSPDLAGLPRSVTVPIEPSGPVLVERLAVRLEQGRLVAPSRIEATLPALAVEVAGHRFTGALEATGDVAESGSSPRLTFDLLGRSMEGARLAPEATLVGRVGRLHVTGDARELALVRDPLSDVHAVVQVDDAVLPDARALGAYLAPGGALAFAGGDGRAHGRVEAWRAEKRMKAAASLTSNDLDLRIASTRVVGDATLDASVDAWRWGERRIEGARVAIRATEGAVSTRERPGRVVVGVRGGGVVVTSPGFDLSDPLRAFSAQLDMADGDVVDLRLHRDQVPGGGRPKLTAAHARVTLRADLEAVAGRAKGSFELHSKDAGLTVGPLAITLRADGRARVHDWDLARGDLVVDEAAVDVADLAGRLSVPGGPRAGAADVVVARATVRAKSSRLAFSDPLGRIDVTATVTGGKVHDASALDALLPAGSRVRFDAADGRFAVAMNAVVERRVARGKVDATTHGLGFGLDVRGKRVGVRGGDVELEASASRWDLGAGRLSVDGLRLVVDELEARFDQEREPAIVARRAVLQGTSHAVTLAHPSLRGADFRVIIPEATMDDARSLNRFFGPAAPIESGRSRVSVDVTMSSSERRGEGRITLALANGGFHTGETRIAGNVDAVVRVHGYYPERRIVDLAGSRIAVREVWSTGASVETTHWDGDFDFLSGELSSNGPTQFVGLVQFHADDAAPILALAFGNDLPGILVGPLRAPGLSGQAHLTLGRGVVAITDGHVRGGDVVVRGDIVRHSGGTRGGLTASKGPLSAGLEIDESGTFVKLWGLDTWARTEKRQVLAVKAGAEAKAEADAEAKAKAEANARAKAEADAKANDGKANEEAPRQ